MQSSAVWLVLVMALFGANAPFMSDRMFLVVPLKAQKSWWQRVAEIVLLYFAVVGLSLALEQRLGQIYPQHWQFYAVSLAMFVVLAFPGFVMRYLVRRVPA